MHSAANNPDGASEPSAKVARLTKGTSVEYHMAPLRPFMEDEGVTEVCVNRPGEVWTEKHSRWEHHEVPGLTYQFVDSFATSVARFANNDVSDTRPILSAVLPGGERIQFVRPNACEDNTISVTIRKPSFAVRKLEQYEREGFFSKVMPISKELTADEVHLLALRDEADYAGFLRRAVQLEKNIVIAGATGSGKTTLMKALMQEIPTQDRIITIEDTPELFLPNHPNHVHLFYPSEAKEEENAVVTSAILLKSCLRMKPTRILLAELRGGEAYDWLNVCASGHGGSITSLHAGSAEMTFERLTSMVMMNRQGRQLPYDVIRRLLYLTVDVVLHVHNDTSGSHGRHITELWYEPTYKRERRKAGEGEAAQLMKLCVEQQQQLGHMGSRLAEIEGRLARSGHPA